MTSSCNLIVIDNFYENPDDVREFALRQDFSIDTYYPGKRTRSFASLEIKERFQKILEPCCGKIISFELYNSDNGTFQYAVSSDRTWIHTDHVNNNWAGIIYLTPDAPVNSGTTFYKHVSGVSNYSEKNAKNIDTGKDSRDYTKWTEVDQVGNIYNRLILFNSSRYHASTTYFGTSIHDARLFQVFFFTTEH